jgi:hypothetical protein
VAPSSRTAGAAVELSVVLPCLNEAETVATCVAKALASLSELGVAGEVVVADNGSTDGSQALARAAGARVVDVPRRGYGAALRHGIDAACGTYVLMADADDSYALDDIGPFLTALRNGADLVMGNRFTGGIEPGAMPFLHRRLGNPVLSLLGRMFFRVPVGDFHCGMRAFRRDKALGLHLQTDGMEFASELVVRAAFGGLSITEVPTVLRKDGRSRAPHLRTWHDGWRHLKFLLAFSPPWVLFYPAMGLFGVGALGVVVLAFGARTIGDVSFSVQSMLAFATCLIVGAQAIGLAVISLAYANHLGLRPPSPRIERGMERITLERGLLIGFALSLAGLAAFVGAVVHWGTRGFGNLDPLSAMRLPIIGMVLIVAGVQLMLVSFSVSLTLASSENG